jgi:hypothetical protein
MIDWNDSESIESYVRGEIDRQRVARIEESRLTEHQLYTKRLREMGMPYLGGPMPGAAIVAAEDVRTDQFLRAAIAGVIRDPDAALRGQAAVAIAYEVLAARALWIIGLNFSFLAP